MTTYRTDLRFVIITEELVDAPCEWDTWIIGTTCAVEAGFAILDLRERAPENPNGICIGHLCILHLADAYDETVRGEGGLSLAPPLTQ